MNLQGYKDHLREMKEVFVRESCEDELDLRKVEGLRDRMSVCRGKIRLLQRALEVRRSGKVRKRIKHRSVRGRRFLFAKVRKGG